MSHREFHGIMNAVLDSFLLTAGVLLVAAAVSWMVDRVRMRKARTLAPFGRRRMLILTGKLFLLGLCVSWRSVPSANAQWTDFAAVGQRIQQMITQMMQYISQIEQKLAAIEQLSTQIKQLEMMTRQLVSLPKDVVRGAVGQVMQFYRLFQDVQGLGDGIKSLGNEFDSFYPTYGAGGGSISGSLQSVKSFSLSLDNWMGKTREASKNVLKAAGMIEATNKVDMDIASQYVEQALYADGQMQVQQAQAGLAQVQIKQAAEAKLQMQALSDMMATETMQRQSKEAAREAYMDEFWKVK